MTISLNNQQLTTLMLIIIINDSKYILLSLKVVLIILYLHYYWIAFEFHYLKSTINEIPIIDLILALRTSCLFQNYGLII